MHDHASILDSVAGDFLVPTIFHMVQPYILIQSVE